MTAFAAHAWNPDAPAVRPSTRLGGLFVNYRATWDGAGDVTSNTNIRSDGSSDAEADVSSRHDPLTDLVILRDLDALLSAGIRNATLDRLRCRLQPAVAGEFSDYGPPRGWVYAELTDLSDLDPNGPWREEASRFAGTLASLYAAGLPAGRLRPDWIAESAAALIDAARRLARPRWRTIGRALALQLCRTSADATTGLFPGELTFDGARAVIDDPLVKVGSQAQLLDGLLNVAASVRDPELLNVVRKGLDALQNPSIGLADRLHGGWFYAVDSDGRGVRAAYKETRQAWLVELFDDAATADLLPATSAAAMTAVVRDQLYQSDEAGFVYRVRPDWSTYTTSSNGSYTAEDWISSEATGIAIQALLGPLR